MRVDFDKVQLRASKRTRCELCAKWMRRATTLWQTISPFNKNAAGEPKTRGEIMIELHAKAAAWRAEPLTCPSCSAEPDYWASS